VNNDCRGNNPGCAIIISSNWKRWRIRRLPKVKLTITRSTCRCAYFKVGDEFIADDLCPPLCHELWNNIYPLVFALKNGATLDYGTIYSKQFDAKCPDEGRVSIHGEVVDE
jgi:uncharacterized repeat protein (TIGR04076 family)